MMVLFHRREMFQTIFLSFVTFLLFFSDSGIRTVCADSCDNLPCLNGGACDSTPGGHYICTCKNDFLQFGRNCETNIDNDVISIYEPFTPTSNQTTYWHTNYVDHLQNGEQTFNLLDGLITFSFKTNQKSAMLLLMYDQYLNYIQVQLIDGKLRVYYNVQTTRHLSFENVQSECYFSEDEQSIWHRVNITNYHVSCYPGSTAQLRPERSFRKRPVPIFDKKQPSNIAHINMSNIQVEGSDYTTLTTYIYLGGAFKQGKQELAPSQFRGCFRGLRFQNKTMNLQEVARQNLGNGMSLTCEAGCKKYNQWSSCFFGSSCDERWNAQFSCNCKSSPFVGPQCGNDTYFQFDGQSVLQYTAPSQFPLSISTMKIIFRNEKLKIGDHNVILFHLLGANKREFVLYLLQSMSLKYWFRSSAVAKPVTINLRKLSQNEIVNVLVNFESGQTNTRVTSIETKVLDKNGEIKTDSVRFESDPGDSRSDNIETFYIKKFFVGGSNEKSLSVNTMENLNYTGCLNNLAVQLIPYKGNKQQIDFFKHRSFKFISANNGIRRSDDCQIPPHIPTFPTPPPTTTGPPNLMSKTSSYLNWDNPSGPEEIPGLQESSTANIKSEFSLALLIGVIIALFLLLLVVIMVIYCRMVKPKTIFKAKSKESSISHFSHDDYSTLPLRAGSPMCSTYATSNGSVKQASEFNPSDSFTLPYRPAYKAMTVVAQEEGFFARGEDDIDSSDLQDGAKMMTNRKVCPGRASSANASSSGHPDSPLFLDSRTPSPPDNQPSYQTLPTISHNRVKLPQWRNQQATYTLHHKRTSPRSSIQSSSKDTDSDSGLGVLLSPNGKNSVTFKL